MNTRKTVVALIVVAIVSFAIGGLIFKMLLKTYEINEEKTLRMEDADILRIETVSADVNIIPSESGEIRAVLHGTMVSSNKNNAAKLEIDKTGQNISIKTKYPRRFFSFDEKERIYLDIYVPKNYTHELVIHGVSGNGKIEGMNLKSVEFTTISGNLSAQNISAEMKFKSESGDLTLYRNRGGINADTQSGNINVDYAIFQNLVEAKTVSGSITLYVPKESCFDLDFRTGSGKLNTDIPLKINSISKKSDEILHGVHCTKSDVKIVGNINLSTNSGNLDIRNGSVLTNTELIESRRGITE